MSIVCLDTGALIKEYVQQAASDDVQKLSKTADHSGTSLMTRAEMAAAMVRAERMKLVPASEARAAWDIFLADWFFTSRLKVSRQIMDRAAALAWEYPLRGYVTVQLASAVLWQEALETQITVATFDRELHSAGIQAGLTLWPATLNRK